MKLLIMQFPLASYYFLSLLGPNILSEPFSQISSVCVLPLGLEAKFMWYITGRITVLYILIIMFLSRRWVVNSLISIHAYLDIICDQL